MSKATPNNMIGVAVYEGPGDYYGLRLSVHADILKRFPKADRFGIRGTAANGFIITPDKKGLKATIAGESLRYISQTIAPFDISKRTRRTVWVRPEFENGHMRVPPLPRAWIDIEAEFDPTVTAKRSKLGFEEANRQVVLPRNGKDNGVVVDSTSKPINGNGSPTAPVPKPSLQYQVPENASMHDMQRELAAQLDQARAIIRRIEEKTGMKFVLDRNLRLVVALT
jgi:hypothetical protein